VTARISGAILEASKAVSSYHRVQRVHFWREDLPKTAMLKVKRLDLRKILEDEARGEKPEASEKVRRDPIERKVVEAIARIARLSPETVRIGDRLQIDLALDSIMRVDLAADLEHRFRRKITDPEVEKWETVGDVISTIRGKAAG
jgi:acyl carrier protein